MIDDPVVAEVRRIRQEHAEKFGYDLQAVYEDIKRRQETSSRKYVKFFARGGFPNKRRMQRRRLKKSIRSGALREPFRLTTLNGRYNGST